MRVRIEPGLPRGTVAAPPSKSILHRLLLGAALADGDSFVSPVSGSDDIRATLACIRALGAQARQDGDTVFVHGAAKPAAQAVLPCHESGTTLRLLLPAALLNGGGTFTGTARLMERGIGVYEALLADTVTFVKTDGAVTVRGTLRPGAYTVPGNISSQFISGLLFALPTLCGDSTVTVLPPVESRPYLDLTVDALRIFGINIQAVSDTVFRIPGGQRFLPARARAEGDWSNAAFFSAWQALGAPLNMTGLLPDSRQGDRVCTSLLQRLQASGAVLDIADCPDLAPVLFAFAAAKHGGVFTGTARLRRKESDRAATMAEELRKCGCVLTVEENRVTVPPADLHAPRGVLCGHGDHRVVMALTVLASLFGATLDGAEAVSKSYPGFFEQLRALSMHVLEEV